MAVDTIYPITSIHTYSM